jgi:hypothetical protein
LVQANQRVYRLAAVGRLLLTDCCGRDARFTVVETPESAILDSQSPGIGGMSVKFGSNRRGKRVADWPAPDRDLWMAALLPGDILVDGC